MPALEDFAPLYARIAAEIRQAIAAGQFPPGAKIPSEPELALRYRVGRPTVRQATQLLVTEGSLERRRGSGTYVRGPETAVDLFSLGGTLDALSRSGAAIESSLVGEPIRVWSALDVDAPLPTGEAYWLRRVSKVNAAPVLLEEIYLSVDVFTGFPRFAQAHQSLSALARDHYGLRVEAVDQKFRVGALGPVRAELLSADANAAVLVVERTIHFTSAPGAVFSVLYCLTDHAEFTQRLEPPRSGGAPAFTGVVHESSTFTQRSQP